MELESAKYLYSIFPELTYVIDRNATASWKLHNKMVNHNLMLLYDGQAEFFCNGSRQLATKGDLIYYKPGDIRRAGTFPENPIKCFAVDFFYTCPIYVNGEWTTIQTDLPFTFHQSLKDELLLLKLTDLFSRLTKSALASRNTTDIRERTVFTEILVLLFQYSERNQYNYSNIRKVEKVISYMTENHSKTITLNELSEYAKVSPSYLGNIFRTITGRSVIDYLIEIRINRAKNLLKDGFSVTEVSRYVGFNDIYYFSRVFKKHEGVSPSKYMNFQSMNANGAI